MYATAELDDAVSASAEGVARDIDLKGIDIEHDAGAATRFDNNIKAISLLKWLATEERAATPSEQLVLAKYSGFGDSGFNPAFPRYRGDQTASWKDRMDRLKELVGEDEYKSIEKSRVNAFYTSPEVIDAMWEGLRHFGADKLDHPKILEPAAGSGRFLGLQPEDMAARSQRTAIELDDISGQITKHLYPDTRTYVMGYQDAPLPDNEFDIAISNVPFGDIRVVDPAFTRQRRKFCKSIHNYYFAKTLDKLRPGGVMAFITSRYTMDSPEAEFVREYISQHADLLGAVRLPEETFPDTKVVTDILYLKKRAQDDVPGGDDWVNTVTEDIEVADGAKGHVYTVVDGSVSKNINEYYVKHPENILGKQIVDRGMYGIGYTVKGDVRDLPHLLRDSTSKLPTDVIHEYTPVTIRSKSSPTGANAPRGTRVLSPDGDVMIATGYDTVNAGYNASESACVREMLRIRDHGRHVLNLQLDVDTDETVLRDAQKAMNSDYLDFAKVHGPLHLHENKKLLDGDPDGPFILAFERPDIDLREWKKLQKGSEAERVEAIKTWRMPIFKGRTIHGIKSRDVTSLPDAISVSLNETGRLDFDYMAGLLGKTRDATIKEMVNERLVYHNPTGGYELADTYLSGNVVEKLKQARSAATANRQYKINVEKLEAVQPEPVLPSSISANLGAPWIPAEVVNNFVKNLLDTYDYGNDPGYFRYNKASGEWIEEKIPDGSRVKMYIEWGTDRVSARDVIKRVLNGKAIVVNDYDSDGNKVRNEVETVAANDKAMKIKEEFHRWVWEQPFADKLAGIYNRKFNSLRKREYDGTFLELPGMREAWNRKLHAHIRDSVWRQLQERTVLLAHEVGFGKTAAMVVGGQEMKRLGISDKNMYVVPKAVHEQFQQEYRDIYPYANILAPDEKDFSPDNRREFTSRIATGNWDAVILSDTQFRKLPIRPENEAKFLKEEQDFLVEALTAEEDAGDGGSGYRYRSKQSKTHKQLQKAIIKIENDIKECQSRVNSARDNTIYFEDLGIDQLYVDEADQYKNLRFATKMGRIKGLPATKSDRAWDMYAKVRHVRDGGNGVVFATGTPIANTIAEMYTMMRYLQSDMLENKGLRHFDEWAKTFGSTTDALEQTPSGDYKMTQRFSKFQNVAELSSLWQEVADIRVASEVGAVEKLRPRVRNEKGEEKRTVVAIPASDALRAYMKELAARADVVSSGGVDPKEDNMLKISSDARHAALDPRMVMHNATEDPDGKIPTLAKNVKRIYDETAVDRGTQLIFLDIGTPKAKDKTDDGGDDDEDTQTGEEKRLMKDVYSNIRQKLRLAGIPSEHIAFIHDYPSREKKAKLYRQINNGDVRVVIGSTQKLGTGVNVQQRCAALHHVDTPWRPRDIEQREGRIIRQGNLVYGPQFDDAGNIITEGKGVGIYTYVTEQSFDAYMWQAIEAKSKAIKSIMRRDRPPREIEDVDSFTMGASEAKAIATGNPDVLRAAQLTNDIKKLQMLQASNNDQKFRARAKLRELPHQIEFATTGINNITADHELYQRNKPPEFAVTVGGANYGGKEGKTPAKDAVVRSLTNLQPADKPTVIGAYNGFELTGRNLGERQGYQVALRNPGTNSTYLLPDIILGTEDGIDYWKRLDNKLESLQRTLQERQFSLQRLQDSVSGYEAQQTREFAYTDKLAAMVAELEKVETRIKTRPAIGATEAVAEIDATAYEDLSTVPDQATEYHYGVDESEPTDFDRTPPDDIDNYPDPIDTLMETNVVIGATTDKRTNDEIAADMKVNDTSVKTLDDWIPEVNDLQGWDDRTITQHVSEYEKIFLDCKAKLDKLYEDAVVEGRVKTMPSVVKKLKKKNVNEPFTHKNLTDIVGIRATFDDLESLKAGVEATESQFKIIEKEDYLTTPKDGYRSVHMLLEQDGKPIEMQFRTENMTRWADWTHDRLYDHPAETMAKVGEAGFKELQEYTHEMSAYYAAMDEGRNAVMPVAPESVNRVGGPMEPVPVPFQTEGKPVKPAMEPLGDPLAPAPEPEVVAPVQAQIKEKTPTEQAQQEKGVRFQPPQKAAYPATLDKGERQPAAQQKASPLPKSMFSGPTKEQERDMIRRQNIEADYINWQRENPKHTLEEAKAKYTELGKEVYDEAHAKAVAADDAFDDAIKKQFGKKIGRWGAAKPDYNEETKKAYDNKIASDKLMQEAYRKSRESLPEATVESPKTPEDEFPGTRGMIQSIKSPGLKEKPAPAPSKVKIPDTKENRAKLFDAKDAKWLSMNDITARPSPEDAIERSSQKAALTLKGQYTPREPLEVWEVERKDGSKFYSLRDGNTTFEMLKRQGWDEVPVNVTMTVPESEVEPVGEHKRTTVPETAKEPHKKIDKFGKSAIKTDDGVIKPISTEYYIKTNLNWKPVKAKAVDIEGVVDTFIHRSPDGKEWIISEGQSGASMYQGRGTQAEVVQELNYRLKRLAVVPSNTPIDKIVEETVVKHGLSPRYSRVVEVPSVPPKEPKAKKTPAVEPTVVKEKPLKKAVVVVKPKPTKAKSLLIVEGAPTKIGRVKAHFVPIEQIKQRQENRTQRSQSADARRTSQSLVTPDVGSRWMKNPGAHDYPGIDTEGKGAIKRGLMQIKNAAGTILTRKKDGSIKGTIQDIPGTKSKRRRRQSSQKRRRGRGIRR